MPDTWIIRKISEVCRIRRGSSPRPIQLFMAEKGIPWLKIADVTGVNSRYISQTKEFIIEDGRQYSRDVFEGNLILSNSATPGIPKLMKIGACVHDGWLIIDDFNNVDKMFMYYMFLFIKEKLVNLSNGSVFNNLKTEIVKNYEFQFPPIVVQKKIVSILSSLDDKIELNNKINKNLEEIAQTLYKRWFVDFEFPNENGEPYKSSGGEMVDSELGMIPKGWEVKTVGDICSTVLGGTPSRSNNEYWNGNINWINSGEVNKLRIISASEKITWLGLNNSSTKLMPKKTTVIAITGATLGAVSLLEIESCANQSVIGIYESEDYPYTYVYGLIINKIKDIIGRQTGGAQQHINKNDVNSFKIVVPVKSLIMSFHKNTDAFHKIIATNMFANVNLSKIRDELLPKLMSGEIGVPVEE